MVVPTFESGRSFKIHLKKLKNKMNENGLEAVLIVRSYPYTQAGEIGSAPEGIGFYRVGWPSELNGRCYLLGELETVIFDPSKLKFLTGREPYISYTFRYELEASKSDWPKREKQYHQFLERYGKPVLDEQLNKAAKSMVERLDPNEANVHDHRPLGQQRPKRRWLK
ncbi:hypothetical protein VDG1235_4289 [Verrucomicrobiia bacterium DG1235]|nr:hypothetical protein VDG1235_4289 [Verrucomicrobiae bacterium DG1235]